MTINFPHFSYIYYDVVSVILTNYKPNGGLGSGEDNGHEPRNKQLVRLTVENGSTQNPVAGIPVVVSKNYRVVVVQVLDGIIWYGIRCFLSLWYLLSGRRTVG